MEKAEAEKEALRQWRQIPARDRTTERASLLAAELTSSLDFRTMGDRFKVIQGWLLRDIVRGQQATAAYDRQHGGIKR